MAFQYVNDRNIILGSADIRVALYSDKSATYATAKSVGLLDGVTFNVSGDDTQIQSDNSDDIDLGLSNVKGEISASSWKNLDLKTLYEICGHVGKYTIVPGTATTVTDELVGMVGIVESTLQHKTDAATPTIVTDIVVKSSNGSTTYVLATDYIVGLTQDGFTTIMRTPTGSITSGSTVKVSYKYTPKKYEKLTYGSTIKPVPLHVWLTNTDSEGRKLILEVYKVEAIKGTNFTYGSDKGKTPMSLPITMVGKPDASRSHTDAYDDLYSFTNYQVS